MTPAERTERVDVRLALDAWESVMTVHAVVNEVFAAESMWSEASMREYDVLYTLAKNGRPMRISEIQNGVLLSQPALSRMIDRLVGRGLLTREADSEDGRAVRVSLTTEGAAMQRTVGRAHAKSVVRELGSKLTNDEMRALRELCTRLAAQ